MGYYPVRIARRRVRSARDAVLRRKSRFIDGLTLLNRTVANTALADRYWIFGGLLLGWAREGAILRNDYRDADFAFMSEDRDRLVSSIEAIREAGFRPLHRWRNNDGHTTEWVFERDGARFEFFEFSPVDPSDSAVPEAPMFRHYGYFPKSGSWAEALNNPGSSIEQVEVHLPYQTRGEFAFLGSRWHKAVDHELELDSLYGERWRAEPKVFYNTPWMTSRHSPAIYSRQRWTIGSFDWDGDTSGD